jgi:hypothetical protein
MYKVAKRLASLSFLLCFLSTQFAPALALEGGGWQAKKEASSVPSPQSLPQGQAQPLPGNVPLDLSSTQALFAANNTMPVEMRVGGFAGGTGIVRGGSRTTIDPNEMLTASQYLALQQLMTSGSQNLILNENGAAVGGFVTLTSSHVSDLTSLNLPTGVTLHSIDFNAATPLNVSGAAAVNGSMYALQSTQGQTAVMNFGSLTIGEGGVLSTELPASATYLSNVYASAGLTANVAGDLHNSGTIASASNLNLNVGGAIYNQSTSGSQALMTGSQVNLYSGAGTFVNSGTIAATTGNLNLASKTATDIAINNAGGVLEAMQGSINVRDASFSDKNNLAIVGGALLAQEINLYSGAGDIDVYTDAIAGPVNTYACNAHVGVSRGDLTIGTMELAGDPVFYNIDGSIIINSSLAVVGDLLIASGRDITSGSGIGTISTDGANAGKIFIVAGARIVSDGPQSGLQEPPATDTMTVSIIGPSDTGGKIDFVTNGAIPSITANSTAVDGDGGDVQIFAFAGSDAGSGTINLPASSTVSANGAGLGANARVLIASNAVVANGNSITAGTLTSTGGTGGAGEVQVATATLTVEPTTPLIFQNGLYLSGGIGVDTSAGKVIGAGISVGAITAPGGDINLTAGANLALNGAISASSAIGGGGNVKTVSQTMSLPSGNIAISANATGGAGAGGTVEITTLSPTSDLTIGALANQFSVSATSAAGNGGKVTITAGRNLTIASASLTAGPLASGNGAEYHLTARTGNMSITGALSADGAGAAGDGGKISLTTQGLVVSGALSADGSGTGNGGEIVIASGGTSPLDIGTLGIAGTITADGGGVSGNGGTIKITTGGALTFGAGSMSASATSGQGGNIELNAGGVLTLSGAAGLNVDAAGGDFDGGTIFLTGTGITVTGGSGNFAASANGSGNAAGGIVTITSTAATDITIGLLDAQISISAEGGAGPATSFGGTVTVTAGDDLFIDPAAISADPGAALAGTGATLTLSAGNDLAISGPLSADGVGSGAGGIVNLAMNSTSAFNLGSTVGTNFVNGTLSADGGASGAGGSIFVTNGGTGGITLVSTANLSVVSNLGPGGTILLGTENGTLTIPTGTIDVDSANGGGGFITLTGNVIVTTGGAVTLSADAGLAGSGGTISVTSLATTGAGGDLSIGTQFIVTADGISGSGGIVSFSAGGNLTVDPVGALSANPTVAGSGGQYLLEAGTSSTGGNLFIDGSFAADALVGGNGGTLSLISNSATTFVFGAGATTNGVNGNSLSAVGVGAAGAGGTITIRNNGTGGVTVLPGAMTTVTATGGNGGTVEYFSPNGTITAPGGTLSVDGAGAGDSNGGNVTFSAVALIITGPLPLTLSANAVNGGNGGEIKVETRGATSDLVVNDVAGGLVLSATGGSGGSLTGDGGKITVIAGRNLTVDQSVSVACPLGCLSAGPQGTDGAGARYTLQSGASLTATGNLFVDGDMSVDGAGTGSAGVLILNADGTVPFRVGPGATVNGIDGTLSADGGDGGVVISNFNDIVIGTALVFGGDNLSILAGGNILTAPGAGAISVSHPTIGGRITILAGSNFGVDEDNNLHTTGPSITGGRIDLATGTAITSMAAVNDGGPGGGFLIGAFAGSANNSGTVTLPTAVTVTGNSDSSGFPDSFPIFVFAGASKGNGVVMGGINTQIGDALTTNAPTNINIALGPATIEDLDTCCMLTDHRSGGTGGAFIATTAGGTANLTVGAITSSGGKIEISSQGKILTGSLNANNAFGDAGEIKLAISSSSTFTIGAGATNGVAGTITANAAGVFVGGTIEITNANKGSINVLLAPNISATSVTGSGGNIKINNSQGTVTLGSGMMSVDGGASGGTLEISALSLSMSGGLTTLSATGGIGGKITLALSDTLKGLTIGALAGQISLFANGLTGNGGEISVTAGGKIHVASLPGVVSDVMDAGPLGVDGAGGKYSLTSTAGKISMQGSLNADGVGTGAGGSIKLSISGTGQLRIGAGAFNGVAGVLTANGTTGGSISVKATGGVTLLTPTDVSVVATNGNGGAIELSASGGALNITPGAGTLSADAGGLAGARGGTITLSAKSYTITGGTLPVSADGASQGGTVSITNSGTAGLFIGPCTGCIAISAAPASGAGGTVTLNSTGRLSVDPSGGALSIGPAVSGTGALLTLTGAQVDIIGAGGLTVANGVGTQSGGSVTITSNANNAFMIGVGGNNGVALLSANSGPGGGNGGSITVTGAGGVTVTALAALSATASSGNGGKISLSSGNGTVSLPAGILSVNAAGAGASTGGRITLSGKSVAVTGGGTLTLNANGINGGDGGEIRVTSTNNGFGGDLTIGAAAANFIVSVNGGVTGNAGSVAFSAGRNLTVAPGSISMITAADGADLSFTAGTGGSGNLLISAALSVDGVGSGDGGTITLSSKSNTTFNIGAPTTNGIVGVLSANGGGIEGAGGTINITSSGTGGLTLPTPANIDVAVTDGTGGTISLNAGAANLNITAAAALAADGAGPGVNNGGTITLSSKRLLITGGPLTISANATTTLASSGAGGIVSVTTADATQDMTVGAVANGFVITATGFSTGIDSGNGGQVTLSSGRNLTINPLPVSISAAPTGTNGNGAKFTFTAGTGGAGNLHIFGSLLANGTGTGDGGNISLTSNSTTVFTTGAASLNGVDGAVVANAGATSGAGGTLSITNSGKGGLTISSTASALFSNVATNGAGGSLTLNGGTGTLTIAAVDPINLNGVSTAAIGFAGGTANINTDRIAVTGGPLLITANGTIDKDGGNISITTKASTTGGDLFIGTTPTTISLSATGGSMDSLEGNGGTVTLSAGRNLIMNTAGLTVGPLSGNGKGATISLTSGTAKVGQIGVGDLQITGTLNASGNGEGDGGTISLTSMSNDVFVVGGAVGTNFITGNIIANGGDTVVMGKGLGGSITLSNGKGQQVEVGGLIQANSTAPAEFGTPSSGKILFQSSPVGTKALKVVINGLVEAKSPTLYDVVNPDPPPADFSVITSCGIIGINSGAGQRITLQGTGRLDAGRSVSLGNLDGSLIPSGQAAGNISVQSTLTIGITLVQNGITFTRTSHAEAVPSLGEEVVDTGDVADDDDAATGELASGM